jgi:hypothetical protein
MEEELYKQIKGKEEIWKPVKGYEGLYEVSNIGRVFSIKKNIIMEPAIAQPSIKSMAKRKSKSAPYFKVKLYKNGTKPKNYQIHRLVGDAFIPNPDPVNKRIINHINEITTDNRVQNLQWSTNSENIVHSVNIKKEREFKEEKILKEEKSGQMLFPLNDFFLQKEEEAS